MSGTKKLRHNSAEDLYLRGKLAEVYVALREQGYDPTNQIMGYLVSEDPTYITSHNNARQIILGLNRYDILESMIEDYFKDIKEQLDNAGK